MKKNAIGIRKLMITGLENAFSAVLLLHLCQGDEKRSPVVEVVEQSGRRQTL